MTLSYHAYRLQTDLHAEFDGNRQRIAAAELAVAKAERTADGIAVIAPSDLMTTFRACAADAWAMLATLTDRQLTIQAIDTACYLLEVEGRDISWSSVLDTWTKRLALIEEAKAKAAEVEEDHEMLTFVDTEDLDDAAFQVWHTAYANVDDARIAAQSAYETAQAEPFPSDEPTPEPTLCALALASLAQPLASLALALSSIARVEACVVCRKREATQTRRGERVCPLCAALYAPALTPDRLAQARAIANQPTTVVRRFVNTVTLKDGSVWDDEGHLLIGPYSPPPIEDDDRAASIAVPVIPRRPSGGSSLAVAFEKTKEQAKETGERAVMSFVLAR